MSEFWHTQKSNLWSQQTKPNSRKKELNYTNGSGNLAQYWRMKTKSSAFNGSFVRQSSDSKLDALLLSPERRASTTLSCKCFVVEWVQYPRPIKHAQSYDICHPHQFWRLKNYWKTKDPIHALNTPKKGIYITYIYIHTHIYIDTLKWKEFMQFQCCLHKR